MGMQGCFIGAETLSKLTNLDAVKQQLWGVQLQSAAAPGDVITGGPAFWCVGPATAESQLMDCTDSLPLQNLFHARYRSLS